MRRFRILGHILKVTGFIPFVISFVTYLLLAALVLLWVEPTLRTYSDSLWYSFVSATTVGYGDIVVQTGIGRNISAILTLYGLIFFGCLSGVIINYYTELHKGKGRD